MKIFLLCSLLIAGTACFSQNKVNTPSDTIKTNFPDSVIKYKLVELAMANPALAGAQAMVGSAKYELKGAKTAWLNSIVISGNVNEFVINNTNINGLPASTLYPKYNIGVNLPLGLFTRQEKNMARERVKLYQSQNESLKREITKEVLIRYENYKEKRELLELQKQLTDGQYSNYQSRQQEYATGEIKDIKEVNKEYESWIDQRSRQRTREKELEIAILELEELIGMRIEEVFVLLNNKP